MFWPVLNIEQYNFGKVTEDSRHMSRFSCCRFPSVHLKWLLTDYWTDNTETVFCLSSRLAQSELFSKAAWFSVLPGPLPLIPSRRARLPALLLGNAQRNWKFTCVLKCLRVWIGVVSLVQKYQSWCIHWIV